MIKSYLKTYCFFFLLSHVGRKTQVATQRNSRGHFFSLKSKSQFSLPMKHSSFTQYLIIGRSSYKSQCLRHRNKDLKIGKYIAIMVREILDKLSRLTHIVRVVVVVVVFLFVFPCFLCLFRGFFVGFVLFLFRSSNLCHQLLSLRGRGGLVWVCLAGIS